MKFRSFVWLGLLACAGATPSHANFVPPPPLQLQLEAADLVVVANMGERTNCMIGSRHETCAEIRADAVLKGPRDSPASPRYLILSSRIRETDLTHVTFPGATLLFLRRVRVERSNGPSANAELYVPVQAIRSILPVDDSNNR